MVLGITLSNDGKAACLVISHQASTVTTISLYSPDVATYNRYYAVIQREEGSYGLANKDPSDHEDIHHEMGRLMSRDPDSTKTHTTHFHWVCKEALSSDLFGGLLLTLTKAKIISKAQMTELLQAVA